ncbi:hypothetical protein [Pseudomonas sp. NMI1173_11]|uniref:hypothetical protein n=1 Tax=Pseudomonas sp. NMI1173_11 TaxID=2903145 RepID=UPI001E3FA6A8|nr:hypothetical protein [Pseudomonas sp. NMI1173_11]MCE1004521.1 hypothetical protein [Pseudomonas sp. NMI1173_11]
MQMSDAVEVVQVAGSTQANEKLAEGWKLLAVVPSENATGKAHVAYVLGKPGQSQPLNAEAVQGAAKAIKDRGPLGVSTPRR